MLDGPHAITQKQLRKDPLHDPAIGQHVGNPAGHSQIVFEYNEFSARQANQIGADDRDVNIAWDLQATHFATKVFAAKNDFTRHDAVRKNAAFIVDIAQEKV